MWRTKPAPLFVLLLIMTLPSAWAIIQAGPSVAYTNNQGSITFPSTSYFNAVYVSASLIQFDLTSTLNLNSASRVNMTSTPTNSQEMEISIMDSTEPLAIVAGTITSSSWFSANHTLLVYSATMKHWFQIGAAQSQPQLLITGPASASRGTTVSFTVLITNPTTSTISSTTLYVEIIGPKGYYYFDWQQATVSAGASGRFQFDWQVPSTISTGSYVVNVGLIPPTSSSISQTEITIN